MWTRARKDDLDTGADPLEQTLHAWREAPLVPEALSASAREGIRQAITGEYESLPNPSPLFVPVGKLALAGGMPAVLLLAVIVLMTRDGSSPAQSSLRVQAAKEGDQVVFTVANGARTHTVYTSHVANGFDARSGVRVRGTFADTLTNGENLTFYKVD